MKHFVFASREEAQALSDQVDAAYGLPWSGINQDTGQVCQAQTVRMYDIVEHPDGTKWAYPEVIIPEISIDCEAVELTPDWFCVGE